MGVNSLPKTVTRQRRGCDLNPGPSAPESSALTTRLPSHPNISTVNLLMLWWLMKSCMAQRFCNAVVWTADCVSVKKS